MKIAAVIDSRLPIPILGVGRVQAEHLRREHIEPGQIYFGFEVDEKLLPFALEEIGDECRVYDADIPHGDRLCGAVDVFLKRDARQK